MSQTIYARVSDPVKEATDAYAAENGMTLANAIASLLDRGLEAHADEASVIGLERQVAALTSEVELLRERDKAAATAYHALAQRTAQPVGTCPKCGLSISGYDLLVSSRCSNPACRASLSPLLGTVSEPEPGKGGLDDGDLKLLLGALGVALGIAYISQQGGG